MCYPCRRSEVLPMFPVAQCCGEFERRQFDIGRRRTMHTRRVSLRRLLAGSAVFAAFGTSAFAAEVTPERLVNADKEPGNWLMNHRTYDAQRFSPLDKISKANVKGLKLAYALA